MTNEIALKPCPFCGATDDNLSVAKTGTCWVRCLIVDCCCEGPMCDNEANAVNAWNTRALPAQGEPAAIFAECAEIALEHVEAYPYGTVAIWGKGYDEACRDIAEAIRLRASNRKTMDAIADAALLKP